MEIAGKVAMISGAAGGIGSAIARCLADSGVSAVALVDIDRRGLHTLAEQLSALHCETLTLIVDVGDAEQLENAYEQARQRYGRIDIVCNNAGITCGQPGFPENSAERIARVIGVNLVSVLVSTQLAIKVMRAQGGGVIINTGSLFAFEPYYDDAAYSASKAGVLNLTRGCAGLLESDNIRVKAICPGITETPMLDRSGENTPEWVLEMLETIHVLAPEEVADGVKRLIEDDEFAEPELILRN